MESPELVLTMPTMPSLLSMMTVVEVVVVVARCCRCCCLLLVVVEGEGRVRCCRHRDLLAALPLPAGLQARLLKKKKLFELPKIADGRNFRCCTGQ
jgi:hypothetical protein